MFISNLIFLYHVIVASENLLVVAAMTCKDEKLREYFERHLLEEKGHAQWLAEDLASVNVKVQETKIPPLAREMVGSIYYAIFHVDPVALLGYMHALESWPLSEERLQELEKQYPASLLRTTRHHAQHDPGHVEFLRAVINELPSHQRELIEHTQAMTYDYVRRAAATFPLET
jgi:rubrerythrin